MNTFTIRDVTFGEGIPKIAVPVSGRTEEDMLDGVLSSKDHADLLELRFDGFEGISDPERVRELLKIIRTSCICPLLFTLRTFREGGNYDCGDEEYESVLSSVIESGLIDLIDVEAAFSDLAESLIKKAHESNIRVILSQHDFKATPGESWIISSFEKMQSMHADIAKGAYMPRDRMDADRALSAALKAKAELDIPFILISMGELGQVSRIYAEVAGSCVTFAASLGRASAPGQLDAAQMRELLTGLHNKIRGKKHLFLIGFMGAGKSTVASELEKRTGRTVIEMDSRIEKEQKMSIPEIFSQFGQERFRDLETELLRTMEDEEEPKIVSCGGGAVLRAENVLLMKSIGKTVLLDVTPEEVMRRLSGEIENRPNLKDRFTKEGISRLQDERRQAYERAADCIIKTDGNSAGEIADRICDFVLAR